MLKDFLSEVATASQFEVEVFAGQLLIRGRVLSPTEIERASLTNSLVLQSVSDSKEASTFVSISEELKGDPSDEVIERAYKLLSKIRPEQLAKISESQDMLICQCVSHARKAEEDNWERIHLVLAQEQQSAEHNRLWIGMLPKEDRAQIIEKALKGQQEAVERLRMFR
tara:strand:- start:602 stop:1105 length:504 start_codon:yes stop_codon:yes gene_type:complete